MKIIKLANGQVVYFGDAITLTAQQATSQGGSVDHDTTSSNAVLVNVDLPVPIDEFKCDHWLHVGESWTRTAAGDAAIAERLRAVRSRLAAQLDAAVFAIYQKPVILGEEYKTREAEAQTFKDADYPADDVPPRVAGFAGPAGMTPRAAADLILGQAAALRGALGPLSDLRMQKYTVARAESVEDAQAAFDAAMTQVKAIAAAIG